MTYERREWRTVDKTTWGPGPWQDEPDKAHWVDPATDLDCLMVRQSLGAWCGYVAVPPGHPAYGLHYDDVPGIDVHGGLTYAAACQETGDPATGVCHVPYPGRPQDVWWLGFDCVHAFDFAPEARFRLFADSPQAVYRDQVYVRAEVERLAAQLASYSAVG